MSDPSTTEDTRRLRHILTTTIAHTTASLREYLSPGTLRDYYLWGLDPECPYRDQFLQITGISQLVKMTVMLLDGLLDDREWERLAPYCAFMNSYQILEIVSDNLAIGLARPIPHDTTITERRTLLRMFNQAMIDRLRGDKRPAQEVLADLRSPAQRISLFAQSLAPHEQRQLAEEYARGHGGDLAAIEHGVWPLLVANMETCTALATLVDDCLAGPLVRDGLIRRYNGVNQLLDSQAMPLDRRVEIGTDTILVVPTLAYYVAVLAEIIRPQSALANLIADGTLGRALHDAALIVRLLNDLGTALLTLGPTERAELVSDLGLRYDADPAGPATVLDVLLRAAPQTTLLTRLEKDIVFGEFNIGLHALLDHSVPKALAIFGEHLDWLGQLFGAHLTRLTGELQTIGARLEDGFISEMISRFVRFHTLLYSQPHATHAGEYAVGSLRVPELVAAVPANTHRKGPEG